MTGVIHLLALASVGLRLYVRIGLLRTPGVDDGFVVGAVVCFSLLSFTFLSSPFFFSFALPSRPFASRQLTQLLQFLSSPLTSHLLNTSSRANTT